MAKTMDHGKYQAALKNKSWAELKYIIEDARETIKANPEGENAGYYMDEIHYASMELKRRGV